MKIFTNRFSKKNSIPKATGNFARVLLALLITCLTFSLLQAQPFKLTRTPNAGNTVTLTTRAKILRVSRKADSYTIWRNSSAFITINLKHDVTGVLPPGNYTLLTSPGGSVTIDLETNFKPENITLWGRHNKIVKPLWDGNYVTLSAPARITAASYDGTSGMSILNGTNRVFYYLSPHNRANPGPKVIGGTGGKTLVGQTLPPGVYRLVPERGNADGIVNGKIVLEVR